MLSQTASSAASALRRHGTQARLAPYAHGVQIERVRCFSKILFPRGRLDIAQGGRRTSWRCHRIGAIPRPGRRPGTADPVALQAEVPAFPAAAWAYGGAPVRPIETRMPWAFGTPRSSTYSRARRARCRKPGRACCGQATLPLQSAARQESVKRHVGQQRATIATNNPSTLAREAATQLVRNAENCASNIQCATR